MESKNIFQFWDSEKIPDSIKPLISTWDELNPTCNHTLYNDEMGRAFIKEHYTNDEMIAFDQCKIPAMKADFLRYCLLFINGGAYADADTKCVASIDDLFSLSGLLFIRHENVANDFMMFTSGHPLLSYAIDQAVSNIKNKISNSVWEVTGPGIITGLYNSNSSLKSELLKDVEIRSIREIKNYVDFVWEHDYKKGSTHWTNSDDIYNS